MVPFDLVLDQPREVGRVLKACQRITTVVVRFRDWRRDGRCVYSVAVLQWEGGVLDGGGV